MNNNFYQTLGISRNASPDVIKRAYRKLALQYHPDKNPNSKSTAEIFLNIQEAYETLSNSDKKRAYDQLASLDFYKPGSEKVQHYFKVFCSSHYIKLNQEVDITFSYTGEGRSFMRPSFQKFFLSGKPIVVTKKVFIEGIEVKETSLIYSLAPLVKGNLVINSARIKLHQQPFQTQEISIQVTDNVCYFLKGKTADGKPLVLRLNYEEVLTGQYYKTTRIQQHDLLIPRSKQAQYFHTFGEVLKYIITVWIILLSIKMGYGLLIGFFAGSIFGSANAELFYKLLGIKSKMLYAPKFPAIQKYFNQGYYLKNRINNRPAFAKAIYIIESIFI